MLAPLWQFFSPVSTATDQLLSVETWTAGVDHTHVQAVNPGTSLTHAHAPAAADVLPSLYCGFCQRWLSTLVKPQFKPVLTSATGSGAQAQPEMYLRCTFLGCKFFLSCRMVYQLLLTNFVRRMM